MKQKSLSRPLKSIVRTSGRLPYANYASGFSSPDHHPDPQATDVRGLSDSRVGVRSVRRKQNNQFLLALIEEEEEGLPELRSASHV